MGFSTLELLRSYELLAAALLPRFDDDIRSRVASIFGHEHDLASALTFARETYVLYPTMETAKTVHALEDLVRRWERASD